MAHDPIAHLLLWLALVIAAAKIGSELAVRLRQPPVLGELMVGIVLGNLSLAGVHALAELPRHAGVDMLARLGLVILLFQVGLASTIPEMLRVGVTSLLVAVVGITASTALGFGGALAVGHDVTGALFFGAAIAATSIGISARVLTDLGKSDTTAGRTILGAAVIDDVLGLMILAIVQAIADGAAAGHAASPLTIVVVVAKAALFLVGALSLGAWLAPRALVGVSRLRGPGALFAASLSCCFLLSFMADRIGLSPIIGAFAAGLILSEPSHHVFRTAGLRSLADLVQPIADFLVPVFFVVIGMRTDLRAFASLHTVALAALLIVAALAGKTACALVVSKRVGRFAVVAGMWPRGEVMLVFAALGSELVVGGHALVDAQGYAALLLVLLVTTIVTPPALRAAFAR